LRDQRELYRHDIAKLMDETKRLRAAHTRSEIIRNGG
jgi:hypothetical protein